MSWDFYNCIFLKVFFQILHFWISTARHQKAPVLQFCMHYISAKYHSFRFQTFEGETFGSFDFLIGHQRVTWLVTIETRNPKYFWNQVLLLVSISKTCLKGNKVIAPRIPKMFVLVPITPPLNLLASHLEIKQRELGICYHLQRILLTMDTFLTLS